MPTLPAICLTSLGCLLLACDSVAASPGTEDLEAEEIAAFPAPAGVQGVAVDAGSYYIVSDAKITKHDKESGRLQRSWERGTKIGAHHLNSCKVYGERLICANSNFPGVPMGSSVEIFDTASLEHVGSHSLGRFIGSLTWLDRKGKDDWWAGFAQYSGEGGAPGRDTSWTSLEAFDNGWRRTGGWLFPESVVERLRPFSASGGAWGADGLLYVTGHDRPEMYVLKLPEAGPFLEHVATVSIGVEGQAFAWDRSSSERIVYAVSRARREIVVFRVPKVSSR